MITAFMAATPPVELQVHRGRITQIRGPNVVQIRRAAERRGGEAGWQDLLSRVSAPCREQFQRPLGLYEWVDAEHFTELSLAYLDWSKRDDCYGGGRAAARMALTSLHQWMLRMITPDFLINSLPRFFAHYHRGGIVTVDSLGPGQAQVSLWSEGMFPQWYHPGLTGWLQVALELTGAKGAAVECLPSESEGHPIPRHAYRLSWKA